jgi:hypothetical protein
VAIPLERDVESLNVAVAAGILLQHLRGHFFHQSFRRRQIAPIHAEQLHVHPVSVS